MNLLFDGRDYHDLSLTLLREINYVLTSIFKSIKLLSLIHYKSTYKETFLDSVSTIMFSSFIPSLKCNNMSRSNLSNMA